MILDLARGDCPAIGNVSVIVVGGGPAGISLAMELDRRKVPVLLLEAGGLRIDGAAQGDAYRAGSISPDDHGPVHRFRHRVLGGTSSIWGGRCIPLDPIDFERRPWLPHSGWPIPYAEVSRYYRAALRLCKAGSPDFDAAHALGHLGGGGLLDMVDPDLVVDRVERFSEPTDFGRAYRETLRRSGRVTVVLNAPVMRVVAVSGGSRVSGVVVRKPCGNTMRIAASIVVVASGALETARLLLASDDERPCGLGNERDLVGRFYQSHLEGHVGELVMMPGAVSRMDYARDREGVYCRRYLWLSPAAQRRERLAGIALRPTHPKVADPAHRNPVLSAMFLVKGLLLPEYARGMNSTEHAEAQRIGGTWNNHARHVANIMRGSPRLAAFAADWTRRRVLARRKLPSVFMADAAGRYPMDVNAEQTPDPDSRVRLCDARDSAGQRRIAIEWRIGDEDRARITRGVAIAAHAVAQAGVARIVAHDPTGEVSRLTRIGGHHIGTARMASSRFAGVVDGNSEAFDVAGLYILGAAAFPTSGFANPTLTIVALAIRMAERIADSVVPYLI